MESVKTAVMLYNGAQHSSTGVTPNMLFLGQEVVLPTDLFQGAPLDPDDGTPNEIIDKMLRNAQKYKLVAGQNQIRAIRQTTAHYKGISRTFEPGDLVFAFSEIQGDQVPHQKLQIKWSGPYVFIRRINSQMVMIHSCKLRLHQRRGEQGPHLDPRCLPQFKPEEQDAAREHANS